MFFNKSVTLLLTAALCTSASEVASKDLSTTVSERQTGFKAMGRSMKTIGKALRKGDGSSDAVSQAGATIVSEAVKIGGWFPAGSGIDDGLDTDALNYIWKNSEKFNTVTEQLNQAAAALVTAIDGGDTGQVDLAYKATKDACSACHRSFRAD